MTLLRFARELVHVIENSGDDLRLTETLSTIPLFLALWQENESEVLERWQRLSQRGHDPAPRYLAALEQLRSSRPGLLPDALDATATFLLWRSAFDVSIRLMRELLVWAEERNDETRMMIAHTGLGDALSTTGEYDLSLAHSTEALRLAELLGDRDRMASSLRHLAGVHNAQGRWEEAMERSVEALALAEEMGNNVEMLFALGIIVDVHRQRGEIDEALACIERKYAMAESSGNKMGLTGACLELSNVFSMQGRHAEALLWYERGTVLAESIGNRALMWIMTGNSGIVYLELGHYQKALQFLHVALDGHREIGFLQGQTHWLATIAETLVDIVEQGGGLPGYLPQFLPEATGEGWRSVALGAARVHADEGARISEQMSKPDTVFHCRVVLARIEAVEGDRAMACQRLEELVAEEIDDQSRNWVQTFLVRIAIADGKPALAREKLHRLLAHETLPSRLANVHSLLWKLEQGLPAAADEHRTTALELYAEVDPENLSSLDQRNIAELNASSHICLTQNSK